MTSAGFLIVLIKQFGYIFGHCISFAFLFDRDRLNAYFCILKPYTNFYIFLTLVSQITIMQSYSLIVISKG